MRSALTVNPKIECLVFTRLEWPLPDDGPPREHGIQELALNLHDRPEQVMDHFGDGSR